MNHPLSYDTTGHCARQGELLVCRLHNSIYGLKHASRQWYAKFSQAIIQFGFSQSKSDYSIFTKGTGSDFNALLIYVDDIIIASPNTQAIHALKQFLNSRFKLKDLGSLEHFLGLEIASSSQGIILSQRHYILQLLEDCGYLGCKPASVPMDPKNVLTSNDGTPLPDSTQYRRLIGRLLYLTLSRPDITFDVHKLSQYLAHPTSSHLAAAHHLLRYFKATPDQSIFSLLSRLFNSRHFQMQTGVLLGH